MSITATMADTRTAGSKMRSIVLASSIGTIINCYDFLIYATAAALVFNKAFFPTIDPLAGTIVGLGSPRLSAFWRGRSAARCWGISAIGSDASRCWCGLCSSWD